MGEHCLDYPASGQVVLYLVSSSASSSMDNTLSSDRLSGFCLALAIEKVTCIKVKNKHERKLFQDLQLAFLWSDVTEV